jgi:hypothetical protein
MASLASIHPGDIIEVDVKGRRAFALVEDKKPRAKGQPAKLSIRPINERFSWREVTAYQVISHYRKTKNTKKIGVKVTPAGHDAAE